MIFLRIATRRIAIVVLATFVATSSTAQQPEKTDKDLPATRTTFAVDFDVKIVPSEKSAEVVIRLGADAAPVEWLLLRADPMRHQGFEADGELTQSSEGWTWHPPKRGGELRFTFSIDHLRSEGSYDSRSAKRWAIFRGDDLVPQIRIRTDPIAHSKSRLRLQLPEGWSAALPYRKNRDGSYQLNDPRSRFDRPAGWFVIGELGAVRERFDNLRLTIAGPAGHGARRMDLLALLRWTMPSIRELFGKLPDRLLVVTAADPMWRGGLSGTKSIYLHADRPLIEDDSTSPMLHELVHTLMRAKAGRGGDWIVEGLAEYYSLELLRRSGTLSQKRYVDALEKLKTKAAGADKLRVKSVDSSTRARAVLVMREIDEAIRSNTENLASLDDVVQILAGADRAVVTSQFREACEQVAGESIGSIFDRVVPPLPSKTTAKAQ
jgi:hypothetical protein